MVVKHNDFQVEAASEFIKCFANPTRLRLLCALAGAEYSAGDLARTAGASMVTASQQLAMLRRDGIVVGRRSHHTIYYRLAAESVSRFVHALAAIFCPAEARKTTSQGGACDPDPSVEKGIQANAGRRQCGD
jgi:DNA-binding transcriptional ArsR family regulator